MGTGREGYLDFQQPASQPASQGDSTRVSILCGFVSVEYMAWDGWVELCWHYDFCHHACETGVNIH